MTIEKAIEILDDSTDLANISPYPDFAEALSLGVEALKARKARQEHLTPLLRQLLPGETKEN